MTPYVSGGTWSVGRRRGRYVLYVLPWSCTPLTSTSHTFWSRWASYAAQLCWPCICYCCFVDYYLFLKLFQYSTGLIPLPLWGVRCSSGSQQLAATHGGLPHQGELQVGWLWTAPLRSVGDVCYFIALKHFGCCFMTWQVTWLIPTCCKDFIWEITVSGTDMRLHWSRDLDTVVTWQSPAGTLPPL